MAHQQLVEIARALSCQARILVLDEPTSALSEAETETLFATLAQLRRQGRGIIYISHRLEEIIRLADRITVLRDGRSIGTQDASQVNRRELVRWMVGRDIVDHFHRPPQRPGATALEVRQLRNARVDGVSFELHYGEVLGFAGPGRLGAHRTGSGAVRHRPRSTRAKSLSTGGRVRIRTPARCARGRHRACARGPQAGRAGHDRNRWPSTWPCPGSPTGSTGHAQRAEATAIVERAVRDFHIRPADPEQPFESFPAATSRRPWSGDGWSAGPKILILDEPTRGVDVGAREEMFAIIGSLVESGMAVLLISSDLSEVLNISHRVAVYSDGRILQTAAAAEITPEQVMEQLTGAQTDEER